MLSNDEQLSISVCVCVCARARVCVCVYKKTNHIIIRYVRISMRWFTRFLDPETTEKLIQSFLSKYVVGVVIWWVWSS